MRFMPVNNVIFQHLVPATPLADFVDSFWMLANPTDAQPDVIVVPDGRVDLFFSRSATEPYQVMLLGLESEAGSSAIPPQATIFAVSFKLLGVEYLLKKPINTLLDQVTFLPDDFWGISENDLNDFNLFCQKLTERLLTSLIIPADSRKVKLFRLIYTSNGSMTVNELSDAVGWSSRQINRYFQHWFGLSLKAYCNILRFRASFGHIKAGRLFPEQNFADQAHFIREVKKYAGVAPKVLHKNKNDRFIQFSSLPEE
jgi:AraC-like DNA-binding protein